MVDDVDLEANVLEFVGKSFGFDRSASAAGEDLVVFTRTETESESKFRPHLVRLVVAFPRAWVALDPAREVLGIARAGAEAGGRSTAAAVEAAAERPEFTEQGVEWRRVRCGPSGYLYVPRELAAALDSVDARRALGVEPSGGRTTGSPSR